MKNKKHFLFLIAAILSAGVLFVIVDFALAAPVTPATTSIGTQTEQTIQYNWTSGVGDSGTAWIVQDSTDTVHIISQALVTPTSTRTYTFTGLATNTLYYLGVASGDGTATSTFVTTSAYTAPATPGTPIIFITSSNTLFIEPDVNENPFTASTTYIIRDTVTSTKYLQSNGTFSDTLSTLTLDDVASGISITGLSSNSEHILSVAAINGDSSVTSAYSTPLTVYSGADDMVGDANAVSNSAGSLTLTFDAATLNGNPTDTTYFLVRDEDFNRDFTYLQTDGTFGSAPAGLTYAQIGSGSPLTITGLVKGSVHCIQLAASNFDQSATTSYTNVAGGENPGCGALTVNIKSTGSFNWSFPTSDSVNASNPTPSSTTASTATTTSSIIFSTTTPAVPDPATTTPPVSVPIKIIPVSTSTPVILPTVPTATPKSPKAIAADEVLSKMKLISNLKFGSKGEQVRVLQQALNLTGFPVAKPGKPGSSGHETQLFSAGTRAALDKFQAAYRAELHTPFKFRHPTGIFGPATLKVIQSKLKKIK